MTDTGVLSPRVARTDRRYRRILFRDAIEHGLRWLGGNSQSKSLEDVREAVLLAYDDLAHYRRWRYYTRHGRIILSNSYDTGTVAYTNSTRIMTLTGGTWPTDVERGHISLDDVVCKVDKYLTSTTIRLDPQLNPGQDVASGTDYTWFRNVYPLPPDFISMDMPQGENGWFWDATPVHLTDILALNRYAFQAGNPGRCFTIGPEPSSFGGMAIAIHGVLDSSSTDKTLDFAYAAMPRPLEVDGLLTQDKTGTVATTASSTTVDGSSTAFASIHQGSVLRISRNSSEPTGVEGNNRFQYEFTIETVTDEDTLSVIDDDTPAATVSGRGYVISDQVDVAYYMTTAFLRGIEWQLAQNRNMTVRGAALEQYKMALIQAASVDGNAVYQRKTAGEAIWRGGTGMGRYGVVGDDAP